MSAPRELPRRVIVAGDGQVGALAAIALRKALPAAEVLVIGVPPDPAALADRAASALPFTGRLHARLGVEEQRLVREAGASHRLVVRYREWGGAGEEGVAAYGASIDPKLKTGFARAWGRGPRNATASAPVGSLGEALAAAGRFAPPSGDTGSPLADVDYALRWNGPAYRDMLVREAARIGVRHVKGSIVAIEPDAHAGIAAVGIEGQGTIAADLYIDCSGPRAALLSRLPGARRRDWGAHLPIRAALFGKPGEPGVSLEDRVTLVGPGWLAEMTGRDGGQTLLGLTEGVSEEAALAALPAEPASLVAVAPGCAAEPWLGNVVALGDAAAHFEPLAWLNLDLAHRQLALLLDLLPGRAIDPSERAEFNRRAGLMADAVLDLLGAHYAAPAALARFGRLARAPSLERLLDQFTRRGRLPFAEETPLLAPEHGAVLEALGHRRGESALNRAIDPGAAEAASAAFAASTRAALEAARPYPVWLHEVLGR